MSETKAAKDYTMCKAMVIDDSRAIRKILSRTLAEFGFEVTQAADGLEALASLKRGRDDYSVILVDWNMPQMDGLSFVKAVRSEEKYRDVRLMMVTTETQVEQMTAALEAGANEYVMKPFTREVIEDKLRLMGALQ